MNAQMNILAMMAGVWLHFTSGSLLTQGGGGFELTPKSGRQVQSDGVVITWSEKNDELRGFSTKIGDWDVISIEPQERIIPIVGDTVAAVRIGDSIAAFSGEKGWWDVIELSKDSKAIPVLFHSHVQIEDDGHLYTFAAEKGRWTSPTDTDLQPLIDSIKTPENARIMMFSEFPFEQWRESLPRFKARGIRVQFSNSGSATVYLERRHLLPEVKSQIELAVKQGKARVDALKKEEDESKESLAESKNQDERIANQDEQIAKMRAELAELDKTTTPSGSGESSSPATDVNQGEDAKGLRSQVEQAFDVRQQLQQLEAQKLRLKLQKIEANLEAREKNRDQIIKRRMEELLDPNSNADDWNSRTNPKPAVESQPIANSPVGMIGPPHLPPSGDETIPSSGPEASAPASVQHMVGEMKWRQPSEVVRSLRNGRNQLAHQVENTKWPQEQVDKYSRPFHELIADRTLGQGTDEVRRDAVLKSAQNDLNRQLNLKKDADRDWHQAWSEYQSQLGLLQLDVEESQAALAQQREEIEVTRQLAEKGAVPAEVVRQAESKYRIAEIQSKRTDEILRLYLDIEKNEPQLNPDYKAPPTDEATGVKTE